MNHFYLNKTDEGRQWFFSRRTLEKWNFPGFFKKTDSEQQDRLAVSKISF